MIMTPTRAPLSPYLTASASAERLLQADDFIPLARAAAPHLNTAECAALSHFAVDAQFIEPNLSPAHRLQAAAELMVEGLAATPERAWRDAAGWIRG